MDGVGDVLEGLSVDLLVDQSEQNINIIDQSEQSINLVPVENLLYIFTALLDLCPDN